MKYKVGDRVKIKSIDWYNEHTLIDTNGEFRTSIESLYPNKKPFLGKELTIFSVLSNGHYLMEETGALHWTDEMIECQGGIKNMKVDIEKVEIWLKENFGDSSIIDCYGNLTNETEVTSSFDTMEELMESFHKTMEE